MTEKIPTGKKDKNGREIFTGDKVKFKHGVHYFTENVYKTRRSFYPFDPSIKIQAGICIDPCECEIV